MNCVCIYEPRGDHGLEGFILGMTYRFERIKMRRESYCRIYHSDTYYETCGSRVFRKYFKEV